MATLGDPKRYRLTVPNQDVSTQNWLKEQLNISASIRQLIREDIQRNGYSDVTCRQVEQGAKRGRPTNAELERRVAQAESEDVGQELYAPEQKSVKQEQPVAKQTVVPEVVTNPVIPKNPLDLSMGFGTVIPEPEVSEDPMKLDLGGMMDSLLG